MEKINEENVTNSNICVYMDALEQMKNARKLVKKNMKPAEDAVADLEKATATDKVRLQGEKETKVPNLKPYTESVEVKDRKELSKLMREAREAGKKFSVGRSIKEGFRYTFTITEDKSASVNVQGDVNVHVGEVEIEKKKEHGECKHPHDEEPIGEARELMIDGEKTIEVPHDTNCWGVYQSVEQSVYKQHPELFIGFVVKGLTKEEAEKKADELRKTYGKENDGVSFEVKECPVEEGIKDVFNAAKNGIKNGIDNIKKKANGIVPDADKKGLIDKEGAIEAEWKFADDKKESLELTEAKKKIKALDVLKAHLDLHGNEDHTVTVCLKGCLDDENCVCLTIPELGEEEYKALEKEFHVELESGEEELVSLESGEELGGNSEDTVLLDVGDIDTVGADEIDLDIKEGCKDCGKKELKEDAKIISDLNSFEPWGGAVSTWEIIVKANKVDELDFLLEDGYPDGIEKTELNDLLWFESDWLFNMLGLTRESDAEDSEEVYVDNNDMIAVDDEPYIIIDDEE